MFISDSNPQRGEGFDAWHLRYVSSGERTFRVSLAKPRLFKGKYLVGRYLISPENIPSLRTGQVNTGPPAVHTPYESHPVSLGQSTTSSSPNNSPVVTMPSYFAPLPVSTGISTGTPTGTPSRTTRTDVPYSPIPYWANTALASTGDDTNGQQPLYEDLDNFQLGTRPSVGAMPNYFARPPHSPYYMNSSSPNTMFGSFSSSIGDEMDMGLSQFTHSPSSVSGEAAVGYNPIAQRQNVVSTNPPAQVFPTTPKPVAMEPPTISPSMLRINNTPSLPVTSSSEYLQDPFNTFLVDTHTNAAWGTTDLPKALVLPSSRQQGRHEPGPQKPHPGNPGSKWGRKQLPDKAPSPQFIFPSNGPPKRRSEPDSNISPKPHSKRSKSKSKASAQSQLQSFPSDFAFAPGPRPSNLVPIAPSSSITTDAAYNAPAPQRSAKDDFLVNSRLSGMKYSQIRKLGNFKEAESTLRGRFRTLVKPKEARVRNPQWQEIDDKLLREAVPKLAKSAENISWKAVADYISNNGGTYQFGYNTCHKRWDYLNSTSEEQVKRDRINGKKYH